jgi:hypothetical protein
MEHYEAYENDNNDYEIRAHLFGEQFLPMASKRFAFSTPVYESQT